MDIDWSKAPEGTTHQAIGLACRYWLKESEGGWQFINIAHWDDGKWKNCEQAPNPKKMTARPIEPWNGKGIPPAGTVCELRVVPHGDWGSATVRFSSANVIVWDWAEEPAVNGKCTSYTHQVDARPIRTSEQIAAEEHEKAIDELAAATDWILDRAACEAVLAAGYRKQPSE